MPLVVKTGYLNAKDENGQYIRNTTIAEQTTQEQVTEINTAGTANINAIEQKGVETLASIPDDYTELSGDVADLNSAVYYNTETSIPISASPDDWKLDGTGKCTQDTSYKLVKYEVAPGDTLHLKLSKDSAGVYQWQSAANVPSSLPNNNLVGTPVTTAIDGNVTVPADATYLIVSQLKTNSTNSVKLVTVDCTIKDKIDELEEIANGTVRFDEAQTLTSAQKQTVLDNIGAVSADEAGIPNSVKTALLACFAKVAWSDNQGQTYYDALYDALYPSPGPTPTYWSVSISGGELLAMIATNQSFTNSVPSITPNRFAYSIYSTYSYRIRAFVASFAGSETITTKIYNAIDKRDSDYYPVPIPAMANRVKVTLTPAALQVSTVIGKVSGSGYAKVLDQSWTLTPATIDFTADAGQALIVSLKKSNDEVFTQSDLPTECVIEFWEV